MEWYNEIQPNEPISQGDIFFRLPLFSVDTERIDLTDIENVDNIGVEMKIANVIVLSQACDIQQGNVTSIMVAEIGDICLMELDEGINRWSFVSEVLSGKRL